MTPRPTQKMRQQKREAASDNQGQVYIENWRQMDFLSSLAAHVQ